MLALAGPGEVATIFLKTLRRSLSLGWFLSWQARATS